MILSRAYPRPSPPTCLSPAAYCSISTRPHLTQYRSLHFSTPRPPIPKPTPFVPDTATFLTLIGRNLRSHAAQIGSWDNLFTLSSQQLKELGVDPPRSRKYLLRWREKFLRGEWGVGGDAQCVERDADGADEGRARVVLRAVPVSLLKGADSAVQDKTGTRTPIHHASDSTAEVVSTTKVVINVPSKLAMPIRPAAAEAAEVAGQEAETTITEGISDDPQSSQNSADAEAFTSSGANDVSETSLTPDRNASESIAPSSSLISRLTATTHLLPALPSSIPLDTYPRIQGLQYHPALGIMGPYVRPVRGANGETAVIDIVEGMWEHRRGHKVDGGERRKAEVRYKKRVADKKAGRA